MSHSKLVKKDVKVKSYPCSKCCKRFSTKFSMQRHFKECGVAPNRVECEKCKKSLKNNDILEKHRLICFGLSKKVVCGLCDELFCSPFSLRRHLWRFHQDEEIPLQMTEQTHKPTIEKIKKCEKDNNKTENDKIEKRILNFSLAKSAGEKKNNFRYYMDVCYDYEFLDDEVDAIKFDKPVIYPLTKVQKESQPNYVLRKKS